MFVQSAVISDLRVELVSERLQNSRITISLSYDFFLLILQFIVQTYITHSHGIVRMSNDKSSLWRMRKFDSPFFCRQNPYTIVTEFGTLNYRGVRRGYLPTCEILYRSLQGFCLPICVKLLSPCLRGYFWFLPRDAMLCCHKYVRLSVRLSVCYTLVFCRNG